MSDMRVEINNYNDLRDNKLHQDLWFNLVLQFFMH